MQFSYIGQAERNIEEIGDYIAHDNSTRIVSFTEALTKKYRRFVEHAELVQPAKWSALMRASVAL